jgi:hypothetical protein
MSGIPNANCWSSRELVKKMKVNKFEKEEPGARPGEMKNSRW